MNGLRQIFDVVGVAQPVPRIVNFTGIDRFVESNRRIGELNG
ncbi:MAG: hypothetical protein AAF456_08915 [Planctomycetota bacterium]